MICDTNLPPRRNATTADPPPSTPVPEARGRYFIEALGRGLAILDCFVDGPPQLTLGDLSTRVGMNRVTTFRLLRTLEECGYVRQEPKSKCYELTLKMLDLQEASLGALKYPDTARPYLEQLGETLGESVSMAVLEGARIRYVARAPARSIMGVNLHVGSLLPAHATSMGKILLAARGEPAVRALYASIEMQAFTPQTVVSIESLIKELSTVERSGYATSNEELEKGLRSAAAPIRNPVGQVVAAINASASTARVTKERLLAEFVPAVVDTAATISNRLGFRRR
jgi:IclR family transcriptional regulator, pca regulon regulatory protein